MSKKIKKVTLKEEPPTLIPLSMSVTEIEIIHYALKKLTEHDNKMANFYKGMETAKLYTGRKLRTDMIREEMLAQLLQFGLSLTNDNGLSYPEKGGRP